MWVDIIMNVKLGHWFDHSSYQNIVTNRVAAVCPWKDHKRRILSVGGGVLCASMKVTNNPTQLSYRLALRKEDSRHCCRHQDSGIIEAKKIAGYRLLNWPSFQKRRGTLHYTNFWLLSKVVSLAPNIPFSILSLSSICIKFKSNLVWLKKKRIVPKEATYARMD